MPRDAPWATSPWQVKTPARSGPSLGLATSAAQPGFTAAAVLALVLGIGVNAILFNIYNALALTPWAVRDAARVVKLMQLEDSGAWDGFSWPAYRYLRDHTRGLSGLTAFEQMACQVAQRSIVDGRRHRGASSRQPSRLGLLR